MGAAISFDDGMTKYYYGYSTLRQDLLSEMSVWLKESARASRSGTAPVGGMLISRMFINVMSTFAKNASAVGQVPCGAFAYERPNNATVPRIGIHTRVCSGTGPGVIGPVSWEWFWGLVWSAFPF